RRITARACDRVVTNVIGKKIIAFCSRATEWEPIVQSSSFLKCLAGPFFHGVLGAVVFYVIFFTVVSLPAKLALTVSALVKLQIEECILDLTPDIASFVVIACNPENICPGLRPGKPAGFNGLDACFQVSSCSGVENQGSLPFLG